jgi:hypothetical protein
LPNEADEVDKAGAHAPLPCRVVQNRRKLGLVAASKSTSS